MRNFLLFALDADGNTNVALLVVALNHNAYIRPVAVLLYAGIMISVNVIRNLIQHIAQESILVKRLLSFQDFVDLSHFSAVFSHYRTGVVLA